jgi:hypothetical protein
MQLAPLQHGNHETMNVMGQFRYAFRPGVEDFRRWRGRQCMVGFTG